VIKIDMFLGEFEYKIDPKGRVTIPPKFRKHFANGIVLNMGAEQCINVYPPQLWDEIAEKYGSGPIEPSKLRQRNRAIFASAFDVELDEQGRVMLPPPLRRHAGIKDSLVIAGANKYLEIWSKEHWEKQKESATRDFWQILESMETRQ